MKKIFLTFMLTTVIMHSASAQLADGFYHFRNTTTGRYISINDTDPQNYQLDMHSGDLNMGGFRTYLNYDTVSVSPSCVFYVRRLDNGKYDLCGQGSSLYELSSGKFGVNLIPQGGDTYIISGTYQGFEKKLADGSASTKDSWLMNRLPETENWRAIPINISEEYIGIRPDIRTADGEYYGTIFAGFGFRMVSPGMKAYYVSSVQQSTFKMEEIGLDVIPASTPVIIRCSSSNPADNKIEPVFDNTSFSQSNYLDGVYCALSGVAKHFNAKEYTPVTMRVIGVNDKGKLAFVKAKPENLYKDLYLRANKAYLHVGVDAADVMTLGTVDGIKATSINEHAGGTLYAPSGIRVPAGKTPRSGIYILRQSDGTTKKIIVK